MKKRKSVVLLLLTFALIAVMASSLVTAKSQEKVRIKVALFSDGQNMAETQKAVFTAFTKEHPDIIPEFMYITSDTNNWNGYLMKIQTMIASGQAPDVINIGLEGVALLTMRNLALPIDDYITAHKSEYDPVLKDIPTNLQKIFIVNGKRYGIPNGANSVVTNINMDLFKQAGVAIPNANWTIDDLKAMAPKLAVNGKYAFGVPTNFFCLQAMLYSNVASPLNSNWSASAINSPQSVEVFQFLQDAIKKGWAPQPSPTINDQQLMTQGRIAMGWWGRWITNDYVANNMKDIWVTGMPKWKTQTTCAGADSFVVLRSTKHPAEAKAVACWTGKSKFLETFMKQGSLPADFVVGAKIVADLGVPKNWQAYYEPYQKNTWRRSQDPPEYADLGFIYNKYMNIIYSGQMSAKEALDKANDEINQCIQNSQFRKNKADINNIKNLYKN
ncbi:MAG TPA: sugar ABC transporter substrate-binding protein [Firmicutes bacterium]|jgi:multiple sugar transport system substrate-binding protein|nr:sugar ABC transporter substrate-binding protein [Bacillota bacterium]